MSAQTRAFRPLAATQNTVVDNAVPATITFNYTPGTRTVRLANVGTATVFVSVDGTSASVSTSMPILANTTEFITIGNDVLSLSALGSAAGSTLYSTVGEGKR